MQKSEENQSRKDEKSLNDQSDSQSHQHDVTGIGRQSDYHTDLPPNADAAVPPGYEVAGVVFERSGPLPPPSELAAYDKVIPGLADRIVTMTEKSVDAGITNDRYVLKAEYSLQWGGLILFYLFVFTCLGSGVYLAMQDKDGFAIALMLTGIASVALAMRGRSSELLNKILGKLPPSEKGEEREV